MKPFEKSLTVFLDAMCSELPTVDPRGERWVIVSRGFQSLVTARDEGGAASLAYTRSYGRVHQMPEYLECKARFEGDSQLSIARNVMGWWGTLDSVIGHVVYKSSVVRRGRVQLEHGRALQPIRELRALLSSTSIEFVARVKILGMDMTVPSVSLAGGLHLKRLTIRERNRRQRPVRLDLPLGDMSQSMLNHPCEGVVRTRVPVNMSEGSAVFQAAICAQREASKTFHTLLSAILLVSDGRIDLGPQELFGGFMRHGTTQSLAAASGFWVAPNTKLRSSELTLLRQVYQALSQDGADKVLARALHRFTLGRQRWESMDQLVDYVIAWETILLTQRGNAIRQELSYRFAVNGASLLYTVHKQESRRWWHKRMRCAYSVRSSIVHGASEADLKKQLKSGDFATLGDLCTFLHPAFRRTVIWLWERSVANRPYRAKDGWELLLWPR